MKNIYCVECASPLDEDESGVGVDAASGREKIDMIIELNSVKLPQKSLMDRWALSEAAAKPKKKARPWKLCRKSR